MNKPNQSGVIKQAATNQQVAQANGNAMDLKTLVKRYEGQIARALPSQIKPERFTRICQSVLIGNDKLASCKPESFIGAMLAVAQTGLEPNTPLGQAYLIPYGNKVQLQIGYQGLIELCYRSGKISMIDAQEVYEHDVFEYEYGLNPRLIHKPALTNRGNVIAYYAVYKSSDGVGFGFQVMSREDAENHAQRYSVAYKSDKNYKTSKSPWSTDFDAMAKKTVLKKLLKYAPKSIELAQTVSNDGATYEMPSNPDDDLKIEMPTIEVEVTEHEEEKA
jgi:recombination protein RecT